MAAKQYIKENTDYDGYNQHFSYIGGKKELNLWRKEGSIQDGDKIFSIVHEFTAKKVAKEKIVLKSAHNT